MKSNFGMGFQEPETRRIALETCCTEEQEPRTIFTGGGLIPTTGALFLLEKIFVYKLISYCLEIEKVVFGW
ncbi:hypothetical protein [Fibrobacter sp.]|uniref:hypothetical protein n=1 Tax=Fibrobacter sp. TaxID=35828 RepID=UPI00388E7E3D